VRAFFSDHFVLPLPQGHRFPMEKYRLLRERIAEYADITLAVPEAATSQALERVHTTDYVARVTQGELTREEIRRIGFPWSRALVERSRRSVGGTLAAGGAALEDGVSVNLAGGTHHAFVDHGEGFCVFNDVAVAIRTLQATVELNRCAVLDLDVHQGNGTATIFAEDDTVFTLSVHGANNFPFRKEQSDLDIELTDRASDADFLESVSIGVKQALSHGADLAFFIAGADPFEGDRLGRLSVSKDGMAERDSIVFEACERAGIPVAVVMSGGYAHDVTDTVDIHESTIRIAAQSMVPKRLEDT
jgi:acetoin utilization deacetylase AcuC-like enzyme